MTNAGIRPDVYSETTMGYKLNFSLESLGYRA